LVTIWGSAENTGKMGSFRGFSGGFSTATGVTGIGATRYNR
jgi:hypothetical protein